MNERRTTRGRKLLAGTVGLATVTMTGCGPGKPAIPETDAGQDGSAADAGGATDGGAGDDEDASSAS